MGQGSQIKIEASEDQDPEVLKLISNGRNKMLQVVFLESGE